MKSSKSIRLLIIFSLIVGLYTIVALRLFYWQIIRSEDIKILGAKQSTQVLEVESGRGEILFQDRFPLATNNISYVLHANPKITKLTSGQMQTIIQVTGEDSASISAALAQDLYWVRLASKLTQQQKKQIDALNIPGFGFDSISSRQYPEASMAAHLTGFVGKDKNGFDRGYFGIEGYYDELLRGRDGKKYIIRDALGNPILHDVRQDEKIDGRTIRLTVDRTVQFIAEDKLLSGINRYQAEGGSIIVMNPKSGAILAMASFPQFDPQHYYDFQEYTNPVTSSLYEPGSTFKVLVMAAGIDVGVVTPDTKCTICAAPVQIGEYQIKTWNDKYHPKTTMNEVIQNSDNTGMVFVSQKLGKERMIEYFKKFGIGDLTGIDLQGEVTSAIREENQWYPVDVATASFGQGISVTPLQLATAVSAIANGGKIEKPHVVSGIIDENGEEIEYNSEGGRQAIKSTTAKVMTAMMVNAVEKGESKWTKLEGYRVAGKTGTAQIPLAGHYDPNQTIASFIGFFPAEDPQILMLVLVDRPKTSIYGSETAAPIFFAAAEKIIDYYRIPPSY